MTLTSSSTSPNGGGSSMMRTASLPATSSASVRVVSTNSHIGSKIVKPSVSSAAARQMQARITAAGSVQELRQQLQAPASLALMRLATVSSELLAPSAFVDAASNSSSSISSSNNGSNGSSALSSPAMMSMDDDSYYAAASIVASASGAASSSSSSAMASPQPFVPMPAGSDLLDDALIGLPSFDPTAPPQRVMQASKILANMLQTQHGYLPTLNFLRRIQKDEIQEFMRRDILEWLLRVSQHFEHHAETFATAVNLFDRFLSTLKVKPTHLQLIAATALLIAAKSQEQWNTHPTLSSLINASNAAFACSDILRMERIILARLKWTLATVTPHLLIHQMVPCLEQTLQFSAQQLDRLIRDAEAYSDAALIEYRYANQLPSTIACGALLCALARTSRGVHDKDLISGLLSLSGTEYDAASACFMDMKALLVDDGPVM
ncbi:hypothetical protein CAOG_03927 [Capsaspora owczarzaki ATCC 30864]|uniref:Cyclin-like domain-containing protein n=1 Tax=Capsaspora owczarzaki (strain ATCC 30864) TaxID=595528 RepID=A0A0D2X2S8_CAPO3|nr:hypothetical protein CAOG_03927 [Capsaspora owczarzaki ATCC 30864]KJE93084.1 hypothetical protein CAOG_003927 [Capsaspora owczarzaki ATCC 30864]|eukprot:XP_004363655.1 hypothetical protein CAOG_03927 [Capsaspora owczarzaki ATCC 30864]